MGWSYKELSQICEILDKRRKPITKKNRVPGPYPYFGASGVLDYVDDFIFDEELVLLGEDGAKWGAGENSAFSISGKTWVNNHAHVLRPDRDKILDSWLIYYLNASDLSPFISGMTVPKLNQGRLREIEIPIPPISEQKRIVAILDDAFADIDKARALTERNLENARELFESSLQKVFSSRGGWNITDIEGLVKSGVLSKPLDGNHGEIHPKKPDYVKSGVPFIMAADIRGGAVDINNCKYITKKQAESLRKGFARDGDILLSHKATVGESAILKTDLDYVMLTPQVTYYRILDGAVLNNEYLYWFFNSPEFLKELRQYADVGSTRSYIGITKQLKLQVAYPNIREQKNIVERLRSLSDETKRVMPIYRAKLKALEELKKSLLQKAFTGGLTKAA